MYVVIHHPVSINNFNDTEDFNISPNPMNDYAIITIPDSYKNSIIQLFDITGKIVFEDICSNQNKYTISKSQLAKGLYWLRLSNESSISKKIIIH